MLLGIVFDVPSYKKASFSWGHCSSCKTSEWLVNFNRERYYLLAKFKAMAPPSSHGRMRGNPVISLSMTMWTFMGYIFKTDKRFLFTFVPNSIIVTLQFTYLLFSRRGVENLTLNSYFFVLHFNCLVSIWVSYPK